MPRSKSGSSRPAAANHRPTNRAITRLSVEHLERKDLLAADLLPHLDPNTEFDAAENQILVATAPADVGDIHYFSSGQRVDLTPLEGYATLGVDYGSQTDLSTFFPENLPRFDWFSESFQISTRSHNLIGDFGYTSGSEFQTLLEESASAAQLDQSSLWSAPVFVNEESGTLQWLTDEIVVAFEAGADVEAFFAQPEFATYRPLRGTTDQFVTTIADGGGLEALRLANDVLPEIEGVAWASVNFVGQIDFGLTPNDASFSTQWHLNNVGQTGGTNDADADLPAAWDLTTGDGGIVVAVFDDGVQTNHPDIQMWTNPGEISGNGVDDDGNGWIDDVNGLNLVDGPGSDDNVNVNNPNPVAAGDNHGTAVAGVAAATTNNTTGVAGSGHQARVMGIKFAEGVAASGSWIDFASSANLAEALYYVAGASSNGTVDWDGADVSNHSWSGGSSTTVDNAFNWAGSNGRDGKGLPQFAATGNNASGYSRFDITGIAIPFNVFDSGAQVELRYSKDGSVNDFSDTVWIADIGYPGGLARFDDTFDGFTSDGDASWTRGSDPAHSHGVSRDAVRAGAISHNQTSNLRSPEIESDGDFSFRYWISSEEDFDGLRMYVRYRTGIFGEWGDWSQVGDLLSGEPANTPTLGTIAYPASLGSTIAVGASTDFDYRSSYSQYGPGIDFVAPSSGGYASITTTDRTGSVGYTGGNYTSTFGGTSSATPLSAGVGALMLARNPELTATQVRDLIKNNADHDFDAFIPGYSTYYGAGRLDANDAVSAAGTDSNDAIAEATTVALDASIQSRIDSFNDVDMYKFTVSANTSVGLDIDNGNGGRLDAYIRLFDGSGNVLDFDDDTDGPGPEEYGRESYLEHTFTTAGTYYLGVSAYNNAGYNATTGTDDEDGASTGIYSLHVNDLTTALDPADFDSDGDVDGDDFLIWQTGFGTTSGADRDDGDANGDGNVDGDDFLLWQSSFGNGSGSGTAGIAVQAQTEQRLQAVDDVLEGFSQPSASAEMRRLTDESRGDGLSRTPGGREHATWVLNRNADTSSQRGALNRSQTSDHRTERHVAFENLLGKPLGKLQFSLSL